MAAIDKILKIRPKNEIFSQKKNRQHFKKLN